MMFRTILFSSLVLTALAHAGCGGPPAGGIGSVDVGDVSFEYGDLGGVHTFGSSPCPQPVGSILVTNNGTTAATVEVRTTSSQLSLQNAGPILLAPGESIEVLVNFNCSSTADVSTNLVVAATPDGGSEATATIPFSLDIQGAP